jgi:hypothetical protein
MRPGRRKAFESYWTTKLGDQATFVEARPGQAPATVATSTGTLAPLLADMWLKKP